MYIIYCCWPLNSTNTSVPLHGSPSTGLLTLHASEKPNLKLTKNINNACLCYSITHICSLGKDNKSHINLPPQERKFETHSSRHCWYWLRQPLWAPGHVPSCHWTVHCWKVLVVLPPWQPISKQLESCRAIDEGGPFSRVRRSHNCFTLSSRDNQQPTAISCKSERKSCPQTGVHFQRSSSARAWPSFLLC